MKPSKDGKQESPIVAVWVHPLMMGERKSISSSPYPRKGLLGVGFPFLSPDASPGHTPGETCCHTWVLHPLQAEKREGSPSPTFLEPFPSEVAFIPPCVREAVLLDSIFFCLHLPTHHHYFFCKSPVPVFSQAREERVQIPEQVSSLALEDSPGFLLGCAPASSQPQ